MDSLNSETTALFSRSSLIKFKASLLETVSEQEFSLQKFSVIFLQLYSFPKCIFPVDSRRFKLLLIFVTYSLKVLKFFFLLLLHLLVERL